MKVSGSATLQAPAEAVFAALNDPAVLVQTIPGCEQLEALGGDRYRMTITAGVASIKGTYLGDVELTDPLPPSAFTLRANGSGAPGTVRADVRVTLDDQGDGTTLLRYDADAVVGGPVGGVGQRVLTGVAKKTAGEFFGAVNALLSPAPGAPVLDGRGVIGPAQGAPVLNSPPQGAPVLGELGLGELGAGELGVFRRAGGTAPGGAGVLGNQLAALVAGAVIALLGVIVGWRLGRAARSAPHPGRKG